MWTIQQLMEPMNNTQQAWEIIFFSRSILIEPFNQKKLFFLTATRSLRNGKLLFELFVCYVNCVILFWPFESFWFCGRFEILIYFLFFKKTFQLIELNFCKSLICLDLNFNSIRKQKIIQNRSKKIVFSFL